MSYPRRTFVVRVRAGDHSVVLEDVQTGERVLLPSVTGVEARIQAWLDALPVVGVPPAVTPLRGQDDRID
jgi:hypothetical protein